MTEFRVLIGEGIKKSKDLEISQAIEILTNVKRLFSSLGRDRNSYSLRFSDLIEGSSDIRFFITTEKENREWNILPSYDMCDEIIEQLKKTKDGSFVDSVALKKFFYTSRKISYDTKIMIDSDENTAVTFTQEESAKCYDKYVEEQGIETIICKAKVGLVDIIKNGGIKLEILECDRFEIGTIVSLKINQLVLDYCINHDIQVGDIVTATIEGKNNKSKYTLLNIYSENINGITNHDI